PGQAPPDRGPGHEGAAASGPLEAMLARQLVESATHRDQAAAILRGKLALGRELLVRAPLAVVQGNSKIEVDLVVEGDGAPLELVARHLACGLLLPGRQKRLASQRNA